MADRKEILKRIREAIGKKEAAADASVSPRSPGTGSVPKNGTEIDLTAQFCFELERIGGKTAAVRSLDEIKHYVAQLLPADKQPVVAVSNGVAERGAPIHDWLIEQGAQIVPSLSQFSTNNSTEQYKAALLEADLGITSADYAVADTGTLVLVSGAEQHRLISLVPPAHVCLLDPGNIVPDLSTLIKKVREESYTRQIPPTVLTLITGTSRTADIELTLTLGVHGPRELHVLLL